MTPDKFLRAYRIDDGVDFRLKDHDPADTGALDDKEAGPGLLAQGIATLTDLQERLYAQDRWAVLLIFQAMDAAGKDSTIKHVMSGVNPQGCQVFSFKAPSNEELDHDFLWRTNRCMPERGRIGIFNRSYYEEVLTVRVHRGLLERQMLPLGLIGKRIWKDRFEDINALERYLARNGVLILKFFLNISIEEQKRRFLSRLDEPAKRWKFAAADLEERRHWKDYMTAYEDMIRHTSTAHAPWFVVPADNKWYTRLVVSAAVIDALQSLNLQFPVIDEAHQAELDRLRDALAGQQDGT